MNRGKSLIQIDLWPHNRKVLLIFSGVLIGTLIVAFSIPVVQAQSPGTIETFRSSRSSAHLLGWAAIASGVVGTGSFMVYSMALRRSAMPIITDGTRSASVANGSRRVLAMVRKPLLNFHLGMNSIGFFAGMAHGFILLRGLDYVSLTLAIAMSVAVGSGLLLKFGSRRIKLYNFQLHGNISLVLLIILLTGMHVLFVREGD